MSFALRLILSDKIYLRDPEKTELGRRIIRHSIALIDNLGFEGFTFRKLAQAIHSTEASIYRYFENKHKLLVYLVAWYWAWLEYMIDYQTHNVVDPSQRLIMALQVLSNANINDPRTEHIDERSLHKIVVAESSKAFLTKEVDGEHAAGLFKGYESLVHRLADIFLELNPNYAMPKALSVTVIEASRKQLFFAEHIPSVTELGTAGGASSALAQFLESLVKSSLGDSL